MDELNILYETLEIIKKEGGAHERSPIPIFSLEGLPGSGKTTQFNAIKEAVPSCFGKPYSFKLPSFGPFGTLLRALYAERTRWDQQKYMVPWFIPLLISADLRDCIRQAMAGGAQYAVMTRGLVSTYYFNRENYYFYKAEANTLLKKHLQAYYLPKVIFYLDISADMAYERVKSRNRHPFRKMDCLEQMRKDELLLKQYLKSFSDVPVYYIDAAQDEKLITNIIIKQMGEYLLKNTRRKKNDGTFSTN